MTWVRIDDGASEHEKQMEAGPLASWLWVCGLCYCNRQTKKTGFILAVKVAGLFPMGADLPRGVTIEDLAKRLVAVRLWERVPRGFRIHDYHDYLPRNVTQDVAAKRAEAGRRGGQRSGETRRATLVEPEQKNEAKTKQTAIRAKQTEREANEANREKRTKQTAIRAKQNDSICYKLPEIVSSKTKQKIEALCSGNEAKGKQTIEAPSRSRPDSDQRIGKPPKDLQRRGDPHLVAVRLRDEPETAPESLGAVLAKCGRLANGSRS